MELSSGERALVARDPDALRIRYGDALGQVAGPFAGALSNGGEHLQFVAFNGTAIFDFTYNDSGRWPGRADGRGSSLEFVGVDSDYTDARQLAF